MLGSCPLDVFSTPTAIEGGSVNGSPTRRWLTVPDLTETLGRKVRQVRRLTRIAPCSLVVDRRRVEECPPLFIVDGEPIGYSSGTLVLLPRMPGFSDEEAMNWLLTERRSASALRRSRRCAAGRKGEVRRVAQALGLSRTGPCRRGGPAVTVSASCPRCEFAEGASRASLTASVARADFVVDDPFDVVHERPAVRLRALTYRSAASRIG